MKKVAFVINSPQYVRNYIDSNALKMLMQTTRLTLLIEQRVAVTTRLPIETKFYKSDELLASKKRRIFNILMYKYKDRSSSFLFRIKRQSILQLQDWIGAEKPRGLVFALSEIQSRLREKIICLFFCLLPCQLIIKIFRGDQINKSFEAALITISPDIVLVPSSAYAAEDIDAALFAKKYETLSFLLIDNWDNLSSKSVLWQLPDYIAVWGEQSSIHARKIQRINTESIYLLGCARFSSYFKSREMSLASYFKTRYALFVGTSLAFNETYVLGLLENEISNNEQLYRNFKIVYRPHPWRQGRDSISDKEWKHIILDPQLSDAYLTKKHRAEFQPALDYYSSLISNSVFVIGGMTSMVIESQIFYKRYLALVHRERFSVTSPDQVYSQYEHFRGLESLDTIEFCRTLEDLPVLFRKFFLAPSVFDKVGQDKKRNYFVYDDGRSYGERLSEAVQDIFRLTLQT